MSDFSLSLYDQECTFPVSAWQVMADPSRGGEIVSAAVTVFGFDSDADCFVCQRKSPEAGPTFYSLPADQLFGTQPEADAEIAQCLEKIEMRLLVQMLAIEAELSAVRSNPRFKNARPGRGQAGTDIAARSRKVCTALRSAVRATGSVRSFSMAS